MRTLLLSLLFPVAMLMASNTSQAQSDLDWERLTALNSRGMANFQNGLYVEALEVFEEAYAFAESKWPKDDPSVIPISINLALLYENLGRFDDAELLLKRAFDGYKSAFGSKHSDTLTAANNLAGLYEAQRRYDEAEKLYMSTLEISERELGPEHSDTLTVANNLADLYRDEGRYNEAEPIYKHTLETRKRLLGSEHPDTLTSASVLAFDYRNFRYSCRYCNERRVNVKGETEGGKADRFPLLDESMRVYNEGPCDEEQPVLLDPCDPTDWRLLGCKLENGKPCSTSQDATEKRRVEESIEILHLHHEPTCKARHAEAVRFVQLVHEAKQLYLKIGTEPASHQRFKQKAADILAAMDRSTDYSGEKHFLLRAERDSEHRWIQDLLEA